MREKSRDNLYRIGFVLATMSLPVIGMSFGMKLIMKEYEIEDPANIVPDILWMSATILMLSGVILMNYWRR